MIDLRQLRYFVGVIETGSVSRAARRLNVAQSAVSQHVTRLETVLGAQLLTRGHHGTTPTRAGQILYAHARRVLRHIDVIKDEIASSERGLTGEVTVGFPPVLSPLLSYRLFTAVMDAHPGIKLRLIDSGSAHLEELLQAGRLDLALLFLPPSHRGLEVTCLLTEELFFVSADLGLTSVTVDELVRRPMLLPAETSSITRIVRSELAARDLSITSLGEVDCMSALKQTAAAGIASTVLPWSALFAEELADSLSLASVSDARLARPVSLCKAQGQPRSDASLTVATMLTTIARTLVQTGRWRGASLPAD